MNARSKFRSFRAPVGLDDGLLRVEASGICGTDVEQYHGAAKDAWPASTPAVLGTRTREELSRRSARSPLRRSGVKARGPGGRGAVLPLRAVRDLSGVGVTAPAPGLSSRKSTRSWGPMLRRGCGVGTRTTCICTRTPFCTSSRLTSRADLAALFNPLGAGVAWAVQAPGTSLGDTVVVLGAGQRGLCCVVALRAAGAGTVIVTDVASAEDKLRLARYSGRATPSRPTATT